MSTQFFLSIKKLKGPNIIELAASHNLRDLYQNIPTPPSINSKLTSSNVILRGGKASREVVLNSDEVLRQFNIQKIRKNAVRCIEIVFSLPSNTSINKIDFFDECVDWAEKYFSVEKCVISAVVHFDQANPHCHLLFLPIRNGLMRGSAMVGGRGSLKAMHGSFEATVTQKYMGRSTLNRPTRAKKRQLVTQVLKAIRQRSDAVLASCIWSEVSQAIEKDPLPFHESLGLSQVQ